MVALTVTVSDAKGRSVSGPTAESFAVFEEGIQQSVSLFGSGDIPVDVALALDTSGSMVHALPVIKKAAQAVVETLRPGDRAAIIDVKGTTRIPQAMTADRAHVASAIDALSVGGTTAFYDGLYTTLRELTRERRQHPELRRQALVVLSDGVDTTSHLAFDDVAEPAAAELPRIYDTIARELTQQYAIGYVSSVPREHGTFTRVALRRLPPAQGTARTRTGYFASGLGGSGSKD